MKIYNNPYLTDTASVSYINRKKEQGTSSSSSAADGHNYDSITISSAPQQTPETSFRERMASRISLETRQSASPQKLDQIQSQIQSGTYVVDSSLIADRLLSMD